MTNIFNKLWLIIWKNLLYRRRHYCATIMEIILPTLIFGLIAVIQVELYKSEKYGGGDGSSQKRIVHVNETTFNLTHESKLIEFFNNRFITKSGTKSRNRDHIIAAFAPYNPQTRTLMDNLNLQADFVGFETENKIEEALSRSLYSHINESKPQPKIDVAVIFHNGLKDLNGKISYSIRPVFKRYYNYKYSYSDKPVETIDTELLIPRHPSPGSGQESRYIEEGFLGLQIQLDKTLISLMTRKSVNNTISVKGMPYPSFSHQPSTNLILIKLRKHYPSFTMLSFIFMIPSVVRGVVSEKESGIKELMKLMGLPNWMHWIGWLINSMLVLIVSISIITIMIFGLPGALFTHSDAFLFWCFLFLYSTASICFLFLISSFFSKPIIATSAGLIIHLVTYYAVVEPMEAEYSSLTEFDKLASALLPNTGLYWAYEFIIHFELAGTGARWGNLFDPISTIDDTSLGLIFLMFIVSSVMSILLTLYLECVLPSEYGIRRPWNFIFKSSKGSSKQKSPPNDLQPEITGDNTAGFEEEPSLVAGVEIKNLTKRFDNRKIAVNGVTVKMYSGEITALLGHNGAGKTTLMSMLTGMFSPTSGTAVINGHDIVRDMAGVRENLGLCPQHNMLFDTLTVGQHLEFFGRLKGLRKNEARRQADDFLWKLKLTEKKLVLASKLSGGQKRRLSLANSLIGGSKVVMLDEPTSGQRVIGLIGPINRLYYSLDPEARREVWDLLLAMRGERTIIITTHFMEEADVLGDRIAIMAAGKLQCYGTSLFLKKFYGTGYTLNMTVTYDADRDKILGEVQGFVNEASFKTIQSANEAEMAITLPSETSDSSIFPSLFHALMEHKVKLGIETIGLSLTTMDEVFVRVGELSEEDGGHKGVIIENVATNDDENPFKPPRQQTGRLLLLQQFYALLMKRFLYTYRKRKLLLFQLLLPITGVIVGLVVMNLVLAPPGSPPSLTIALGSYRRPISVYTSTSDDNGLGRGFKSVVGDSAQMYGEGDIVDGLLKMGHKDVRAFSDRYVIAAEFTSSEMTGLYSTVLPHSAPLVVNAISNTLLKSLAPQNDKLSIQMTIHPIMTAIEQDILSSSIKRSGSYLGAIVVISLFVPLGLTLLAASFIVFPIEERLCKAKQLQLMTGVNPLIYWGTSLLWDLVVMVLIICVMLLVILCFEKFKIFSAYDGLGVMFLILFVYGFSGIAFSYCVSIFVSTVSGGFVLATTTNIFAGMLMSQIMNLVYIMVLQNPVGLSPTVYIITGLFEFLSRLFPSYGIAQCLMKITNTAASNSRCNMLSETTKNVLCDKNVIIRGSGSEGEQQARDESRMCCVNCKEFPYGCFESEDYLTWKIYELVLRNEKIYAESSGIGEELFYLFLVGVLYLVIVIIAEFGLFKMICQKARQKSQSAFQEATQDSDVRSEDERVRNQMHTRSPQTPKAGAPAAYNTVPVAHNTYPAAYSATPAVDNVASAADNAAPAVDNATPAADNATPAADNATPAADNATPAADNATPIADNGSPAADNVATAAPYGDQNALDDLLVERLGKSYGAFAAVSNLSFGVHHGECFGLLGVNGAGKTTTFLMLTGDELISTGNAFAVKYDLKNSPKMFHKCFGYCPQFDGIIGVLSGKEMLQLFGSLRGIPFKAVTGEANKWLARLGLSESADVQCQKYSGGMKRRLSAGMAMIGDPPIILLDEPTSGVDPISRRQFWNILSSLKSAGQSIVLTSHSMDECEFLCSRLGIMVNGQLQCLGGVQHLKSKFAQGYSVTIKLKPMIPPQSEEMVALILEIETKFHPCALKDQHQNVLKYQLLDPTLQWDNLFLNMESIKTQFESLIEEYSVNETTLEEIFLAFARQQYPQRSINSSECCNFN